MGRGKAAETAVATSLGASADEASAEAVVLAGSPARMSAREIGTAPSVIAARITSPAVPVASSAAPLRMKSPPLMPPTACLGLAAAAAASEVLVAATAPPGSPATGSVPGQVATNTTLRVGWSVSDATPHGMPPPPPVATTFLTDDPISPIPCILGLYICIIRASNCKMEKSSSRN